MRPSKCRFAWLCLGYLTVMLYSSTVIGPAGLNFVPRDPAEVFRQFLTTRFVAHGSDQRADWIGNLLMLVPFGFLMTGAVWPKRRLLKLPAALGVVLICFAAILAIKYLQLFFPPRTVTLNYIAAQSLGAVIGCTGFALLHGSLARSDFEPDPIAGLVLALWLYLGALLIFLLMPLDFALDATDLHERLGHLPDTVLALPGSGRPPVLRAILITLAAAAFIPVGMLLTLKRFSFTLVHAHHPDAMFDRTVHRSGNSISLDHPLSGNGVRRFRRGILPVAGLGLLVTTSIYLLSVLVISAFPVMPSILYRTGGIIAGALLVRWLACLDTDALKQRLRRLVPAGILAYIVGLLLVNRLLSTHWLSFPKAVSQAYPLGLMPLFDYYIVTKSEAAKNIIGHVALYAPIGVMVWLRYGKQNGAWVFILAATVSLAVEVARYFRAGLEGDINAVLVAGLAAMLTARLMPALWSAVEALVSCR